MVGSRRFPPLTVRLPRWLTGSLPDDSERFSTKEERMRFALGLARENMVRGTGGPFGAAVFERDSGRLVAPGVNLVFSTNCAVLHAEMVAIIMAQRALGRLDLGEPGLPAHELVSTAEPCAMCMGAVPWSGVGRLVCGARDRDVRALGFDEGSKPRQWIEGFRRRGIEVVRDVLRQDVAALLRDYVAQGGRIYNGGGR